MTILIPQPRLKGYRFPRSIISYAIWAYHRFALSLRDVEDLLAERGVTVSYETIRAWVGKFGAQIAKRVRAARKQPTDKWHLDEVVIVIRGNKHWLWRAVDSNGEVLDILVQTRQNARAAKRFISRLICRWRSAACHHNRQVAQLRCRPTQAWVARGPLSAQGPEQSHRRITQADTETREDTGPVQIRPPSAEVPGCP